MHTQFTELTKTDNGNLKITLTDDGREELSELLDNQEINSTDIMLRLLESHLCNGWDSLQPEEIGALTGCDLIIGDNVQRDDHGKVTHAGRVYWHAAYQVEDPAEMLQKHGEVVLIGNN